MRIKFKNIIFIFTILGFIACQKREAALPNPLKESNKPSSETEAKSRSFLISELDEKQHKHSSLVTVWDKTGKHYVKYKLFSDNQGLFNATLDQYKNSSLIIEDKDQFLLKNGYVLNTDLKKAEANVGRFDENNIIHIAIVEENVDKEKVYSLAPPIETENHRTYHMLIPPNSTTRFYVIEDIVFVKNHFFSPGNILVVVSESYPGFCMQWNILEPDEVMAFKKWSGGLYLVVDICTTYGAFVDIVTP